jgi:CRISPR/Cas system-associated protein Cas5 (RAMP superfamily)
MVGALIGGIIGYQSDEALAGALIGGAILGVGELLSQTDEMTEEKVEESACSEPQQDRKVVVEVTNSSGSITPVLLTKKGSYYVGPNGEAYTQRPTDQQLRPAYGL